MEDDLRAVLTQMRNLILVGYNAYFLEEMDALIDQAFNILTPRVAKPKEHQET